MRARQLLILSVSLAPLIAFTAYSQTPEQAKKELAKMNIEYSKVAFLTCAYEGNTAAVNLFLAAGMNPNVESNGWTALTRAAWSGYPAIVQALLEKGAEVNARTIAGLTALMLAAENSHIETVQVLLANGAEINAKANKGETALMLAAKSGHTEVANLLKQAGAKE